MEKFYRVTINFWARSYDGDDWIDSENWSTFDTKEQAEKNLKKLVLYLRRELINEIF